MHWAFNQLMEVGWQPDLSGEPLDQFQFKRCNNLDKQTCLT